MEVSTKDLRRVTQALLQHLEETGQTTFEIDDDYYWEIPAEKRYQPYEKPTELQLGQLSDDWTEVTRMVGGERKMIAYGLVWLSAVIRRVGEKAVG